MDSPRRSLPEKICVVKLYYTYGNYAEVSRQWKNHFDSIPPTRKTMADIISRFEDTGSVAERLRPGRPKSATSGDQKAAISAAVSRSPQKSTRRASLQLGIPHTSVWRLYKELNLKPFRPVLSMDSLIVISIAESSFVRHLWTWWKAVRWTLIAFCGPTRRFSSSMVMLIAIIVFIGLKTIHMSRLTKRSTPLVSVSGPEFVHKASLVHSFLTEMSIKPAIWNFYL